VGKSRTREAENVDGTAAREKGGSHARGSSACGKEGGKAVGKPKEKCKTNILEKRERESTGENKTGTNGRKTVLGFFKKRMYGKLKKFTREATRSQQMFTMRVFSWEME